MCGLLDLTGGGGGGLAAHAGGVDRFGQDQVQVFVVRDLVQPVTILQQLDIQVLVDLLQGWTYEHVTRGYKVWSVMLLRGVGDGKSCY